LLTKITEYYSGIELHVLHPEKSPMSDQEWVSIRDEVNERYRPIHDQWRKALNDAEEDTRRRHFTPSDPEWGVMIEEYLQDRGISLQTLRQVLIAVLEERGYQVFEKATKYSLGNLTDMKRELGYQRSWGKTHPVRLP